jgi:hypothetical protein
MYDINVRKLALWMVGNVGMLRTSAITNISRTTLWRWKRFGVDRKRRTFESKLFQENKDLLKSFLLSTQCTTARGVVAFFREVHSVRLSSKSAYKFINLLGFSRKRTRLRGQCKGDLGALIKAFCARYTAAVSDGKTLVSVDECGFRERIKPIYGYSPVGQPVIVKTSGGWVHHSLLMAVFSDGRKAFVVKKADSAVSGGPRTAILTRKRHVLRPGPFCRAHDSQAALHGAKRPREAPSVRPQLCVVMAVKNNGGLERARRGHEENT